MELFTWQGLLALFIGGLYGAVFGSIPGLTATLAVALFVPFAFYLDPIIALPAIVAISSVAIYAGDVGSTVAKIPGTPASAAYVEEIFEIAQRRGPVYGLGISAMGSAVGGLIGTILLIGMATAIARIAVHFSSFEYLWVAALGLTAGVFAAGGSATKAAVSLLLGILLSTVGLDPTLGYPRFDFGSAMLLGGLDYIVAMIGLFGFSEVITYLYRGSAARQQIVVDTSSGGGRDFFIEPLRLILARRWLVLRSSLIGTFVGFLPGAGADIAAWVSVSLQKMGGRSGAADANETAVLAGSSSNNASVAGTWIPALSLGLPGDSITAIVLAVFLMKGLTPGPLFFTNEIGLIWSLYATFILANLFLLPGFGYLTARIARIIARTPLNLLMCVIAGLCVVGAYSMNNNPFDVWVMGAMGLLAFVLRLGGFPLAQVVLGMVLGPIIERNFMASAAIARWDLVAFFNRPVALFLMLCTIAVVIFGGFRRLRGGEAR
jgi:TctA family transporter